MEKSIRNIVLNLMIEDRDYNARNNLAIIKLYKQSSEHFDAQEYIDKIFMHLTGYTLKTILEQGEDLI
jgi:hypothetical protein